MSGIPKFYQKIMAIPLRKKKAPKSKGKKHRTPTFEPGPDVEALDVFKTTLERDAGSESEEIEYQLSKLIDILPLLKKGDSWIQTDTAIKLTFRTNLI